MQKLTPFIWLQGTAEDACKFYTSLIEGSSYEIVMPGPEGAPLMLTLKVQALSINFLNLPSEFVLTPAFSFQLDCEDQDEVDRIWEAMRDGGTTMACGWITDKYGLTWQVIPRRFMELLTIGTPSQVGAVMEAMQQMIKLEVAPLEAAFEAAK
ncbi:MAG: VOC family protein [Fimbriimonas sp.]|jgi:predicted 3-demethylubiquinone-9 3-methyltransferase (glyoxalase superfamily)|nr:VOC family protein [Fimbriimonas sp.]